jgi:hypothetical protein
MKRYRVTIMRDRIESAEVEVTAADGHYAAQEAFRICRDPGFAGWTIDPPHFAFYTPDGGVVEIASP